jgi:hypothetical protein
MCDQTNINFSVDKLSSLDIDAEAFSFRNNPQLNNCDIDENMPNDVNFRYYSCDELSTENYYNISSLSRKNTILAILYRYIYIYIYLASDPKWQGTNGTLEIGPMQGTCQRSYKLLKKTLIYMLPKLL